MWLAAILWITPFASAFPGGASGTLVRGWIRSTSITDMVKTVAQKLRDPPVTLGNDELAVVLEGIRIAEANYHVPRMDQTFVGQLYKRGLGYPAFSKDGYALLIAMDHYRPEFRPMVEALHSPTGVVRPSVSSNRMALLGYSTDGPFAQRYALALGDLKTANLEVNLWQMLLGIESGDMDRILYSIGESGIVSELEPRLIHRERAWQAALHLTRRKSHILFVEVLVDTMTEPERRRAIRFLRDFDDKRVSGMKLGSVVVADTFLFVRIVEELTEVLRRGSSFEDDNDCPLGFRAAKAGAEKQATTSVRVLSRCHLSTEQQELALVAMHYAARLTNARRTVPNSPSSPP